MTLENSISISYFVCDDVIIKDSLSEKIPGLILENNLSFIDRIFNVYKTQNHKLNAFFFYESASLRTLH